MCAQFDMGMKFLAYRSNGSNRRGANIRAKEGALREPSEDEEGYLLGGCINIPGIEHPFI